jgi:hypothetical protein
MKPLRDVISDCLWTDTTTTTGYERLHEFVEFLKMLGANYMGEERSDAMSLITKSDFVILTTLPKTGVFPFFERFHITGTT